MDFRNVDVPGLKWSATAKGPRNVQRVTVQTPRCNCSIAPTTGGARKVEIRVPAAFGDFLDGIDDSAREAKVVALAKVALDRAAGAPWSGPMTDAFVATARMRDALAPLLGDYATDLENDALPSLWGR